MYLGLSFCCFLGCSGQYCIFIIAKRTWRYYIFIMLGSRPPLGSRHELWNNQHWEGDLVNLAVVKLTISNTLGISFLCWLQASINSKICLVIYQWNVNWLKEIYNFSVVVVLLLLFYFFGIIGIEIFSKYDMKNCCK